MAEVVTTLAGPAQVARGRRIRTVRVALAGCGVVGSELVRLLETQAEAIEAEAGVRFEVARVLVRQPDRPRDVLLPRERFTADVADFLAEEVDLVVEALGGVNPALQIARSALQGGRRFVTANKGLIALHGPELGRLARRSSARLDFESAVGGGIPVVRALRDSLARSGVVGVRGILNGTTNYILTRLAEGAAYADALSDAQALGFAESDPSRDVNGQDAADKIVILGWLAFGVEPTALPVRRRGILPDPDRLAGDAAAMGGVPRLLAECVLLPDGVAAAVEPVIVGERTDLGGTRHEQNVVLVETRWNGTIRLGGPGAGGSPTAAVLLADMVRGARPVPRPGARSLSGIPDPRLHRWVVSVDQRREEAGFELAEQLRRAGIGAQEVQVDRDRRVARALTEPAAAAEIEALERALESAGLSPVVSRYEL